MKKIQQAYEKISQNPINPEIRLIYFHNELDEYFLGYYGKFLWWRPGQ